MTPSPAKAETPSLRSGERVGGRYVVEAWIGRGGMAEVYAALDEASGRRVALKVLRRSAASDQEAAERLRREGRVLQALRHPAIVAFEATGTLPDGRVFLAMELLEGQTLRSRIEQGPMLPGEVGTVLEGLVSGLAAAHARGIVHRDLKPDNVFLCGEGPGSPPRVKILDFGISKVLGLERLTRTGQVLGTPRYMAPEQLQGDEVFDALVDVYALGVLLYEALSGCPPFEASGPAQLIPAILGGRSVPLRARRPELSEALADVVHCAMAPDRTKRFGSVSALLQAWQAALRSPSRPSWSGEHGGGAGRSVVSSEEPATVQVRRSVSGARAASSPEARAGAVQVLPAVSSVAHVSASAGQQPEVPAGSGERVVAAGTPAGPAGASGPVRSAPPRWETEPVEIPVRGVSAPRWLWLALGAAACLAAGLATAVWLLHRPAAEGAASSPTATSGEARTGRQEPPQGAPTDHAGIGAEGPPLGEAPPPAPGETATDDRAAGRAREDAPETGLAAPGPAPDQADPAPEEATRGRSPTRRSVRAAGHRGRGAGHPKETPPSVASRAGAPPKTVAGGTPLERARAAARAGQWRLCTQEATEAMRQGASSVLLKLRGDCRRQLGDEAGALRDYHRFCRVAYDHPAIA